MEHSKAWISVGFVAAMIGASVASSSLVPVAYGAGELTPSVGLTSIIGTLTAIVGSVTGFWNLFKSQGGSLSNLKDFAKDAIGNLTERDVTGTVLDAAFVTIAAAILARKANLDTTLATKLFELRKEIETTTSKVSGGTPSA